MKSLLKYLFRYSYVLTPKATVCINQAGKNSNIITLVTIITMLLLLYCGILRILAYSEQFISAFSGTVKNIQQYSVMFTYIEEH